MLDTVAGGIQIVSAALLLGAGGRVGAVLLRANLGRGDRRDAMARAAGLDRWVAMPAALLLPLSAALRLRLGGAEGWGKLAVALAIAAGLLWFLAGAMRRRMEQALAREPFDAELYRGLFGLWFLLGWPALPAAAGALVLGLGQAG